LGAWSGWEFRSRVPLSIRVGNRLRLHISSDVEYELTFLRLRVRVRVHIDQHGNWSFEEDLDAKPASEAFTPIDVHPTEHPLPENPWNGCHWPGVDYVLRGELRSGMYAAFLRALDGSEDFYIVFVVKPAAPRESDAWQS
jgi:hypothetical protein